MTLPLKKSQVLTGAAWLSANYVTEIQAAIAGTPITLPLVQAIACKETHNIWLPRINSHTASELLPLCVGDASGDYPGTSRGAFPKNTPLFRSRYGDAFTDMLIGQANNARALRGLSPAAWVYKGYGIFQYDLQHVVKDEAFFRDRMWHDIGPCLERLVKELTRTFAAAGGDRRTAVRLYNGKGQAAETYADHVMQFLGWCEGRV